MSWDAISRSYSMEKICKTNNPVSSINKLQDLKKKKKKAGDKERKGTRRGVKRGGSEGGRKR